MPPSNQGFAQRPGLSPVQPSSPTQAQSQAQPAPPAPPLTVQTADTSKVSGMLVMMHDLHLFSVLLLERPGVAVKLLPCDHEVMGSSPGNSFLQKCRERLRTSDPKWSNPSTDPAQAGSTSTGLPLLDFVFHFLARLINVVIMLNRLHYSDLKEHFFALLALMN
jgi:hypothetical protein